MHEPPLSRIPRIYAVKWNQVVNGKWIWNLGAMPNWCTECTTKKPSIRASICEDNLYIVGTIREEKITKCAFCGFSHTEIIYRVWCAFSVHFESALVPPVCFSVSVIYCDLLVSFHKFDKRPICKNVYLCILIMTSLN